MQITGYDAQRMTKVLDAIHAVSPMNGYVTKYVDGDTLHILVKAELMWESEDGDIFADSALDEWNGRGGDVRELAAILGLEIEITL